MRRVLLCLALFFASPLLGNSKSLFINGVYAANYGDIAWDKGDWRGNNFSAIRLKAGLQLLRIDFVSLTLGFQKVGFYEGLHKWSGEKKLAFDYRGPVLEVHLYPDELFGFSFAGATGSGYSVLTSADQYHYTACAGCKLDAERSSLKVGEVSACVTGKVSGGLQLIAGVGTKTVTGSPEYDVDRNGVHTLEKGNSASWKESTTFILVGLRGTTL
mgnify:CR=1 FL=1